MFSSATRSALTGLPPQTASTPASAVRPYGATRIFLIVGAVIFAASLLGLASRHAFSVSFWPANAVLAGLMVRNPRLRRPIGWLAAGLGYVMADLLFGRTVSLAALFAGTNLIGTFTATVLLRRLREDDLRLRRVHSVLRILACLLPACIAAGLSGALLVRIAFDGSALQALMTWPASELVNYLIALPAMLTVSPWRRAPASAPPVAPHARRDMWPIVALTASCVAAVYFDGPGSIMFPMPALLLCALTYSVPTTAVLTMVLGTGCLTTIGLGIIDIGQDMSIPRMVVSIRIAIAFLVLVPLTISSAMAVRDDLLARLRNAADHDGLTGLLNRRAFEQRMHDRLKMAHVGGNGLAILWIDIDHFKAINDRHGHLAGDAVLKAFAMVARGCCRSDDLVGRWGGEEFALVMHASGPQAAKIAADRLRMAFAAHRTPWNGASVGATVSIGACHLDCAPGDVPGLIQKLDAALYRAKRQGRNRIEWLEDRPAPAYPSQS